MKTLLVDNESTLTQRLALLSPGEEEIVPFDKIPNDVSDYSLIILSGSILFPIPGNEERLKYEVALIANTTIPVVGICFGHELIVHAFGGTLIPLDHKVTGLIEVSVVQQHRMFNGRDRFTVYENHRYGITDVGHDLELLAVTDTGAAVVKHKTQPVYGFQFHPEHHTDKQYGDEVFVKLFHELVA